VILLSGAALLADYANVFFFLRFAFYWLSLSLDYLSAPPLLKLDQGLTILPELLGVGEVTSPLAARSLFFTYESTCKDILFMAVPVLLPSNSQGFLTTILSVRFPLFFDFFELLCMISVYVALMFYCLSVGAYDAM